MNTETTPILLIIFNRPEETKQVLAALRQVKPSRLFVAGDGPRPKHPDDQLKCQTTRELIKTIDWPCEIKTLFQEQNLGCKQGPITAISWFFDQVDAGIILEDDCVPAPSFFSFCGELLDYYKDDQRIMHIGGSNFLPAATLGDQEPSYYFSQHVYAWGWATWRRAWQHFDGELKTYPAFKATGQIYNIWKNKDAIRLANHIFRRAYEQKDNSVWDAQWVYAVWSQGGLSIVPKVNLVTNIGFGADATHTKIAEKGILERQTGNLGQLRHPLFFIPDRQADEQYNHLFLHRPLITRIWSKLSRQLKSFFSSND